MHAESAWSALMTPCVYCSFRLFAWAILLGVDAQCCFYGAPACSMLVAMFSHLEPVQLSHFCRVCPEWQVSSDDNLTLGVNPAGSKKQRKQVMWFDAIMDQQRFGSGGHVTQHERRT